MPTSYRKCIKCFCNPRPPEFLSGSKVTPLKMLDPPLLHWEAHCAPRLPSRILGEEMRGRNGKEREGEEGTRKWGEGEMKRDRPLCTFYRSWPQTCIYCCAPNITTMPDCNDLFSLSVAPARCVISCHGNAARRLGGTKLIIFISNLSATRCTECEPSDSHRS